MARDKIEEAIPLLVLPSHVEESIPQQPEACTMACAMKAIGLNDVKMSYDLLSGDIYATWQRIEIDPSTGAERSRILTAVVEPNKRAMQVLAGNDLNRARLLKVLPEEGWELRLTHVRSRWKQRKGQGRPGYVPPKPGEGTRRRARRTRSRMTAMTTED